jgi:dienelactone hydrolase
MTTVVLFHHALGQTPGFLAFADDLRAAGHTVHTPDLYEGRTFTGIEDGVAHAQGMGSTRWSAAAPGRQSSFRATWCTRDSRWA